MISRARVAGVDRILAVGQDLGSSRKAVALAAQYDMVFAAVGVHPHRADKFNEERREVEQLLNEDKVVAVGEIGLDWLRGSVDRATQTATFNAQVVWATERQLPISVHNRGAQHDVLDAVRGLTVPVVLHCFDGDRDAAEQALSSNCFLSFAGNLTFKKSGELREVARRVPSDRFLVETDSPVLAPQPRRGNRNEPAFIVETAEVLASLRGTTLQDLSTQVSSTALDIFRWTAL